MSDFWNRRGFLKGFAASLAALLWSEPRGQAQEPYAVLLLPTKRLTRLTVAPGPTGP